MINELGPFRHDRNGVGLFRQQPPKYRMMPTELMCATVPMLTNTFSQLLHFCDELVTCQMIEVYVHYWPAAARPECLGIAANAKSVSESIRQTSHPVRHNTRRALCPQVVQLRLLKALWRMSAEKKACKGLETSDRIPKQFPMHRPCSYRIRHMSRTVRHHTRCIEGVHVLQAMSS